VRSVNIALEAQAIDRCRPADADGSGRVTVDELVQAVNAALRGCFVSVRGRDLAHSTKRRPHA
jgi:hypothetical protein